MASSATTAGEGTSRTRDERTPAQWFAYLTGAVLLVVGLLGFIADSSFDTGSGVSGDELLIFEVNAIHNLVHIASGLLLLAVAPKRSTAKYGVLAFGVVYGLVTLVGIIDGESVLGLIPVNSADNVLHIALTATALLAGAVSSPDDARATAGPAGAR
jgi:Domain of unknown function (DUF4383)